MDLKKEKNGNVTVVYVSGEIDRDDEDKLNEFFSKLIKEEVKLAVLNLSGLDYINSSVLGIFVKFYKELKREKGEMIFSNVQPFVLNMLRITHINDIIKIYSVEKEAVESLK